MCRGCTEVFVFKNGEFNGGIPFFAKLSSNWEFRLHLNWDKLIVIARTIGCNAKKVQNDMVNMVISLTVQAGLSWNDLSSLTEFVTTQILLVHIHLIKNITKNFVVIFYFSKMQKLLNFKDFVVKA